MQKLTRNELQLYIFLSNILTNLQPDSNILASLEADQGNCLPYVQGDWKVTPNFDSKVWGLNT